jgi:2-iminoacetate synthase ThiH
MTNLLLHGIDVPSNVRHDNTFSRLHQHLIVIDQFIINPMLKNATNQITRPVPNVSPNQLPLEQSCCITTARQSLPNIPATIQSTVVQTLLRLLRIAQDAGLRPTFSTMLTAS